MLLEFLERPGFLIFSAASPKLKTNACIVVILTGLANTMQAGVSGIENLELWEKQGWKTNQSGGKRG